VFKYKGRVWKFGSNIDTDAVIPARYLNVSDPGVLASHCFEIAHPKFCSESKPGDIIVAEENFGCGSSREHAPVAIKAKRISCIIARTFARIFYRNAFNIGLPLLESPKAASGINDGDIVEVDIAGGIIRNISTGQSYQSNPLPHDMLEILKHGGLLEYLVAKRRSQ